MTSVQSATAVNKIIEPAAAAELIQDNARLYIGGSGGGHGVPERMLRAIRERFDASGSPKSLMVTATVSIGDWDKAGLNLFDDPTLLKRIVASGLNNTPSLSTLAMQDKIEAYTLPQGALAQLTREAAAGRPGVLTKVGLHTFADPRQQGCRQSPSSTEDLVELVDIKGEEYLLYKTTPIDVAIIRASVADEHGNLTLEDEAYIGENYSVAAAAKRNGGIVIAQVQRTAAAHSLPQREVRVPGFLVDYVVIDPDQKQTYETQFSAAYAGKLRVPSGSTKPLKMDLRKVIARRGAMELRNGATVNIGFGVSNGITVIAAEEDVYKQVTMTSEQGIVGGMPAPGKDAGAGVNYDMLVPQPDQFDFYDGGGLDVAFLSFAEVDANGNVNVSRFGDRIIGPGGFVNISQGARKIVFSGTLTTGGLQAAPNSEGGLSIDRDGDIEKWVPKVEQITFNGQFARSRGQEVLYITERAVFTLDDEGLILIEIADGVDLKKHVLDRIGFNIRVADNLRKMDARIFRDQPMSLAQDLATIEGETK
ncbi:acyl CoA:acetate/3-ketoacid CoA transferase [Halomonas dongshanensis]|uniref:Acetate CoA-transferase YdiF n=1 Tax=Halomonas dongshanensis TaxID=2890835 RepID=A0ABT2EAY7_9GAMM|nr:CoA-transferase [Halomonas dongshanensis]MCS2608736.1 acyl CoA:acetate/3-ketoacid CoA transferase [Halomonas dongshanensis]